MSFTSFDFVIFFVIAVGACLLLDRFVSSRAKQWLLLAASYFFYGYWDWRFCFLLLFVTVAAYVTALHAEKKPIYWLGILIPLLVLGFFKYFNFFLSSFAALVGRDIGALKIILPVGISFYTFQALSYVIDVKRKKIPVETDFMRLALYLSFFPQLVAGPIVKAADFLPQLREDRRVTAERLRFGVQLILIGFFKKCVLADHLSVFVDDVFRTPLAYHWTTLVLAVFSYSLQIYFDFSGYSDIAIGCAHCLGYDLSRNFNLPYISKSVTEFWRRWHISLSTWLKEYLYISLGGNRKGNLRRHINLMLTMLLGGLWHGASWTFVFWGGLNGLALCLDKVLFRKKTTHWTNSVLRLLTTCLFISFTWIFFRAETFEIALAVIRGIVTLQSGIRQPFFWSFVSFAVLLISTLAAFLRSRKLHAVSVDGFYPTVDLNRFWGLVLFFVFCGLVFGLAFTGEHPFVYFQF